MIRLKAQVPLSIKTVGGGATSVRGLIGVGPTGATGATGAPGGSDASFAGWINDTTPSLTRAALSTTIAAQLVTASVATTPGKNLYDKDADYGPSTFWNGVGTAPIALAGWYASAKFALDPSETQVTFTNARQVETFNAAGTALRYINNPTSAVLTVTVAAGETQMAFNVSTANRDTAQAEYGASATAYEPYGRVLERQLVGGAYLADRVDDVVAGKHLAGVVVYRSGNDFLVRSEHSATEHLCIPVSLDYSAESTVSFVTDDNPFVLLVAPDAGDDSVFPVASVGVAIQGAADDACPINVQWSYVGAAHGYSGATTVTMTAHGKANADRGSTWTDGTRTYTLLKVIDANTLLMGHQYTVSSSVVTGSTTIPSTDLTHVANATNTATITVAGGKVLTEIHPVSHSRTIDVRLDGRLVEDGRAAGQVLTIAETYDIVSFKALIDWSRANVGSDPFANLTSMTGLARIGNTYRFTQGQVVVAQRVQAIEKTTVNVGVTQSIPLTIPAGGSKKQFMPGVGTVGGLDFTTYADLSTMAADIDIAPANYSHPLYPPQRMVQWAYDSGAAAQYGLEVGILPLADGAPSQRVKNAATKTWFISNSFKKNYPQIAWAKTLNVGDTLAGTGYRAYLAPPDTTAEVVVSDGSDSWAFLDRPAGTVTAARMKTPTLLGKRLQPIGAQRVSGYGDRVTGDGISYAVAAAPGHGTWKAIDERVPAPALLGAAKTVGNYFSYSAAKTTMALTGSYQILYLFPMTLPVDTPIDRAILDCSTLGTGVLRHGVYTHDFNTGQPVLTAPLADFGTLDITSTGIKGDSDLAAVVTLPTVFWYGIVWQVTNTTAPTIRSFSTLLYNGPIDLGSTGPVTSASSRLGYFMSGVTGALGALSGLSTHALGAPAVIFRRAAA